MSQYILKYQDKVLELLEGKLENFYLAGGTALSLFYFHHRQSDDLDFFTQEFNQDMINKIIDELSRVLKKPIKLIKQQTKRDTVQMAVYSIQLSKENYLKIDFVQDYLKLLKSPKIVNGIPILSLEDIYLRKLYALTGTGITQDMVGRKTSLGGRQEAKDFCDLYFLSHTFMRLSDFASRYCDAIRKELLIRWFNTYDRLQIKTGLLDLKLKRKLDFRDLERHFKKEIDRLVEKEVSSL